MVFHGEDAGESVLLRRKWNRHLSEQFLRMFHCVLQTPCIVCSCTRGAILGRTDKNRNLSKTLQDLAQQKLADLNFPGIQTKVKLNGV